jgi:hypothetical protein
LQQQPHLPRDDRAGCADDHTHVPGYSAGASCRPSAPSKVWKLDLLTGEFVPDGFPRALDAVDGVANRLLNVSLGMLKLALGFSVLVAGDLALELLRLASDLIATCCHSEILHFRYSVISLRRNWRRFGGVVRCGRTAAKVSQRAPRVVLDDVKQKQNDDDNDDGNDSAAYVHELLLYVPLGLASQQAHAATITITATVDGGHFRVHPIDATSAAERGRQRPWATTAIA